MTTFFLKIDEKNQRRQGTQQISLAGSCRNLPTSYSVPTYCLLSGPKPLPFGWTLPNFLFRKAALNATVPYDCLNNIIRSFSSKQAFSLLNHTSNRKSRGEIKVLAEKKP